MKCHNISPSNPLWNQLCQLHTNPDEPLEPDLENLIGGILVESNGKFCARAICYANPHHIIEGEQHASVGYLYCENKLSTFQALSNSIIKLVSTNNLKHVLGPMNGSTWNEYRLVSSEQEKPFLLEPVTTPYLVDFFEKENWARLAEYYSQHADRLEDNWQKVLPRYEHFINKGVSFEEFDKSKAGEIFNELADFCNKSFAKNYLFSPISNQDFVTKMMQVLPILDPSVTIIARNNLGEIVGFIFTYQDLLNQVDKTLIIKTLARAPEFSYSGLGSVLVSLVMRNAKEKGFAQAIHALMLDSNSSTQISSNFSGSEFRRYTLFSKAV